VKVSLFITCYNDTLFPETGKAVVRVLERLGHTIDFPQDQTCCGQMHWNTGYHRQAVPIIRHFVSTFRDAEAVCIPSSSCVAMIREHYLKAAIASEDQTFINEVESLLPRVYEFSEFLVNKLGVTDVGATYPHRVTYHASCHSLRSLHLGDIPFKLLRQVRSIQLVDLPEIDQCCGFGGTFAIKYPAISGAIVEDKIACIAKTEAGTTICNDAGCTMNISGMCHRHDVKTDVKHIAELMAEAMGLDIDGW